MNGQSRDTGTIGYTRYRTKTNRANTQDGKLNDYQHSANQKPGVNTGTREG